MQIALVDGVRSHPVRGLVGVCQLCGSRAVAKCGPIMVHHWAHASLRTCDEWWENEGPWHRAWKSRFPVESHEIVHFDSTGEKHIADVKLPSGLVVELQNSPMSLAEMRSRERFYGNMIWIVNGERFKNRIHLFCGLPDPEVDFISELKFFPAHSHWVRAYPRSYSRYDWDWLYFMKRSEVIDLNGTLSGLLHYGPEWGARFRSVYEGHHQAVWVRPNETWLRTLAPTYLDVGDGLLLRICHYGPEKFFSLQIVAVDDLIDSLR